jgi:hypothetical protein
MSERSSSRLKESIPKRRNSPKGEAPKASSWLETLDREFKSREGRPCPKDRYSPERHTHSKRHDFSRRRSQAKSRSPPPHSSKRPYRDDRRSRRHFHSRERRRDY